MSFIEYISNNCLHNVSVYLAYSDIFMALKYTSKQMKNEIMESLKIQRRKNMIYVKIIKQNKYLMSNNIERQKSCKSHFIFNKVAYDYLDNIIFILNQISIDKLTDKQKIDLKNQIKEVNNYLLEDNLNNSDLLLNNDI